MSLIMKAVHASMGDDDEEDAYISLANVTGFNLIDMYSGSDETSVYGFTQLNGGFFPRIISVVGESATGKTTLSIQLIGSAIERWRNMTGMHDTAEFLFYDIEHNTPISRIRNILRWTDRDIVNTLEYDDNGASILDIYNRLRRIAFEKERNKKDLMYTTTFKDVTGEPIKVYAPTFVLVDSVAVLDMTGTNGFEVDKAGNIKDMEAVSNNIDGARDAKAMTALIKKCKPLLGKFNIHLIMINHITEQMITGMFDMPKRFLPFLKPGEKLKGGAEMIYQSYAILKLDAKEKIDERKPLFGDKIKGLVARVMFVKNKNNVEGLPFSMVFDQSTGYRPELSDFEYLNEHTFGFSGSPMAYRLDMYPEISFTRKTIIDKCQEDENFALALSMTARFHAYYNVVLKIDVPALKPFSALDLRTRLVLIHMYGTRYPGYKYGEVPCMLPRADVLREFDIELDVSRTVMSDLQIKLLTELVEDEPEYVAGITKVVTPYSELIDDYYFSA